MDTSPRSIGPTADPDATPIRSATPSAPAANSIAPAPALPLGERILLYGELAVISALAWLYLVRMPMTPQDLGGLGARMLSAAAAAMGRPMAHLHDVGGHDGRDDAAERRVRW